MLAADDPVEAFVDAHERGRSVALRTSGTSGAPRAVVRTTGSWVSAFPHVTSLLSMSSDSRVWIPGPLTATMNLFAAVHAQVTGARVVSGPTEATHAHLTPSRLYRALAASGDLRGVRVVVAGDRLPVSLHDQATAAGLQVSHYYGAAELSFVAWGSSEDDLRPFPEVEVSVRGGEIWARSPYLCWGYDGPAGALRTDADGFATVGDRGSFAHGHLVVIGRGLSSVTTAGATVQVEDVERTLGPVVDGQVFVLGVPHAELGHVVTAVLTDARSLPAARAHARTLPPEQQPRLWFEVRELPLSEAGKVDRRALTDLVLSAGAGVRPLR